MHPFYWYILKNIHRLPALYRSGKRAKAAIPKLPEAKGPRQGYTAGEGTPLRLLLLGESTMAGVGVEQLDQGLSGHFLSIIDARSPRPLEWEIRAESGITAGGLLNKYLLPYPPPMADIAFIALGANDTFDLIPTNRWQQHMQAIFDFLQKENPNIHMLVSPLPPVPDFPALPLKLREFMFGIEQLHANALAQLAKSYPNVQLMPGIMRLHDWQHFLPKEATIDSLFSDGVHPSEQTYRIWAEQAVDFLALKQNLIH